MRTVLCFGDSNTWGYIPGSNGRRFARELRWPVRLQHALGEGWEVISEGLNGRAATMDSPVAEGRNGLPYLVPCLHSHAPIDLLVVFLGTNDAGERFALPEPDVARSVGRLVKVARSAEAGPNGGAPAILVLCPPPFDGHRLGPHFAEVCSELDCELLDLDGIASYVELNGDIEHLDEAGHAAVAAAVEERIRQLAP
ncbi:MAG TPA: GDSL-type esterase/lipase family protein [Gaiellaceae bacterium]|nr:GDSL-type esterase/lipase family protein [Gaiellaceae bacterium]